MNSTLVVLCAIALIATALPYERVKRGGYGPPADLYNQGGSSYGRGGYNNGGGFDDGQGGFNQGGFNQGGFNNGGGFNQGGQGQWNN